MGDKSFVFIEKTSTLIPVFLQQYRFLIFTFLLTVGVMGRGKEGAVDLLNIISMVHNDERYSEYGEGTYAVPLLDGTVFFRENLKL